MKKTNDDYVEITYCPEEGCDAELTQEDQDKMRCSRCGCEFVDVNKIEKENVDMVENVIEKHVVLEKSLSKQKFDIFYEAYPKKKNKRVAKKIWDLKIDKNEIDDIMIYLKTVDGLKLPEPAKFLNKAEWRSNSRVNKEKVKKEKVKKEKVDSEKSVKKEKVNNFTDVINKIKMVFKNEKYVIKESRMYTAFYYDNKRRFTISSKAQHLYCEFFNVNKILNKFSDRMTKSNYRGRYDFYKYTFVDFNQFMDTLNSIKFKKQ